LEISWDYLIEPLTRKGNSKKRVKLNKNPRS
jgi:hypothetical protein